jgi:hypothetical protein
MRKSSHWFAPYVRLSGYRDADRVGLGEIEVVVDARG